MLIVDVNRHSDAVIKIYGIAHCERCSSRYTAVATNQHFVELFDESPKPVKRQIYVCAAYTFCKPNSQQK